MRYNRLAIVLLLFVGWTNATYAQQDVEKLIEKPDAAIQAQIRKDI